MAKRAKVSKGAGVQLLTDADTASLATISGVGGPGRWLLVRYLPASLFSLKASSASSGVGRTLLVPTPYSVKMALLDAGLTSGLINGDDEAEKLVLGLRNAPVRVGVPEQAVVTHTIIKIRQEPKTRTEGVAYGSNVAYREFVHFSGEMILAWDLHSLDRETVESICSIAPVVRYMGKRGSFFQFCGFSRSETLGHNFTATLEKLELVPNRAHIAWLDDFGPEVSFDVLNSFSKTPIKREKHRRFVQTIVPLGRVNVGPGFTHYQVHSEE